MTTAAKAGFITGLYVVIFPLVLALEALLGAGMAPAGLFLLSLQAGLRFTLGDQWVRLSALVWALHVIAVGQLVPERDPLRLALVRCAVCSLLGIPAALLLERGAWPGLLLAVPAALYTGVPSIGLGCTGQIIAQRRASPTHAAISPSLESVFAALSVGIMHAIVQWARSASPRHVPIGSELDSLLSLRLPA